MNAFDLVLVLLLALFAARGYRRGALSLIGSFAGALGGFVAGATFAPALAAGVVGGPGLGLALLTLGLLLVCLLVGQAAGLAVGHRLRAVVAGAGAAPADRAAGLAVGVAGLIAALWLVGGVLAQGPWPGLSQQLRGSQLTSALEELLPAPPDVVGQAGAYLDRHGFPQAFSGLSDPVSPPVDPPTGESVEAATAVGVPSTVRIEAAGCGVAALGSGFASREGFVVTNAHVVAGADAITVRDQEGAHDAVAVHVDDQVDLAVLRVPGLTAPPLSWVDEPAERGTAGATLGFPGRSSTLEVRPAAVQARTDAVGHDIYGRGGVSREILSVSASVERGDSGGPFVTSDGQVGGVVFAGSRSEPGTAYVLTAESVRGEVNTAVERDAPADTGACRY